MTDDPNRCGNATIDGLAARGRMLAIWDRLLYRYEPLRRWADYILAARKLGTLRRTIERTEKYACLAESPVDGPRTDEEWQLLAEAALASVFSGRTVSFVRRDLGHTGELVTERARGAFVRANTLGELEYGVILTTYSWVPLQEIL